MSQMGVYRGSTVGAATASRGRASSLASSRQAGTASDRVSSGQLGTLLWIGGTSSSEFEPAKSYCIQHAPQIAIRDTVQDAMTRPAAAVRGILIAESTRKPVSSETVSRLRLLYPKAEIACLMGAGCEGMHAKVLNPSLEREARFYAYQWNQVLPNWLTACGATRVEAQDVCNSVAVVASSMSNAEAMMDLAESAGATAVWCRDEHACHVRGIDAVWWDDSIAKAGSQETWTARLNQFASHRASVTHAWIANLPRPAQIAAAEAAGVDVVLSKPYRTDALLETLGVSIAGSGLSAPLRRAA